MNVLDLFSGIGGFSLGLERAGMRTVAFCEIDPFCRRVLAKHWPSIPCYDDVRSLTAARLRADGIAADVICGGFPCQDISSAGTGSGLEGKRSGLWFEYARIIGELRPSYIIMENVAALLNRGLDRVLGSLAALGFDAEWHCIPASAVGAPHRRDRLWLVAYPMRSGAGRVGGEVDFSADSESRTRDQSTFQTECSGQDVADAECEGLQGGARIGRANARRPTILAPRIGKELGGDWLAEPDVGRVAHGISDRAYRIKGLGNAVVPQIPEIIGRAIMNSRAMTAQAENTSVNPS